MIAMSWFSLFICFRILVLLLSVYLVALIISSIFTCIYLTFILCFYEELALYIMYDYYGRLGLLSAYIMKLYNLPLPFSLSMVCSCLNQ